MNELEEALFEISKTLNIDIEILNKHFDLFLEKINPDRPLDLEFLRLEFAKTIIKLKEEVDGQQ